jgi:hypothetical protein
MAGFAYCGFPHGHGSCERKKWGSPLVSDRGSVMSASTARRCLEYLAISYQVVMLAPYSRNLTSTVIKSPKL